MRPPRGSSRLANPRLANHLATRLAAAATLVAIGLHTDLAVAQSNYRLSPVGGRSQLLGGTGMVYARDASAAFLNPATAVGIDDNRLSFSVNFYSISFVNAPRWYTPGPIDRNTFGELRIDNPTMTDLEFNALPSSLCIFFRTGEVASFNAAKRDPRMRDARIGFCLATIQSQSFNFAAEGFSEAHRPSVTRQAQTLSQSYTRFAAGPTYAMYISNYASIGASIHASLASHRSLLAASATTYGSSPEPITSMFYAGSRGDSFQVEALLGGTLRFGKQTLGLSVKSPSLHVYGVGGANRQYHFDGAGSETQTVSSSGSFVSRSPLRVGLGTGVEGEWGNFEVNTFYSTPLGAAYSAELEGLQITTRNGSVDDRPINLNRAEPARGVVNFAAGLEAFLSPRLSLLGGLSTDFSAVPSGVLSNDLFHYYPYQTHRVAGSFGVSSHGDGGEFAVGAELSAGWGQRLAVNSYRLPPTVGSTGHGTYQIMFVIAGSASLRSIKRAVEDVKKVLVDPKPAPTPTQKKPDATYNPREQEQR